MHDLADHIASALQGRASASSDFDLNPDYKPKAGRVLRPAAVLALIEPGAVPQIILTKRSSALKHHPGQIAFPGGKQDDTDTDLTSTALREAQEEIGLDPSMVTVLGQLPSHETVTGFQVTPIIAMASARIDTVPERGEVDEVFRVPLPHVLTPANFIVQSRRWQGHRRHYYTVPYGPYYIWGATARMLRAWADLMT